MKQDENIREVQRADGTKAKEWVQDAARNIVEQEVKELEIKKYGMWWPAHENDKGEVYPYLFAPKYGRENLMDKLKQMLMKLEKSEIKEIDFSNWDFTGVYFDKSMINAMGFADKINFQNANFCYGSFFDGRLKNADFSGATFDQFGLMGCTWIKCNFSGAVFSGSDPTWNNDGNMISASAFIGCDFSDAQLNDTKIESSKFIRTKIDRARIGEQKPSVLNKLDKFKASVAGKMKADAGIERETQQKEHQREER